MPEPTQGRSLSKRILLAVAGLVVFTLMFVIACRLAVMQLFMGIEQSRTSILTRVWDVTSMWPTGPVDRASGLADGRWISRNADLSLHTDSFDQTRYALNQVAGAHQGFLESLVTETHSGRGRALSAVVAVPATEFDPTLADLKRLGRVEAIAEAGEDSAVKLETASRNLSSAETTLARLQTLQRDRKGQLHDALEVEKEIAQADSAVREAARQRNDLLSTVALARIHVTLLEDFRAPFNAHFADASLRLRNSFIDGVGGIFQSVALVVGVVFEYGLPLLFWGAILLWPARILWRRFRPAAPAIASVETQS